MQGSRLILDRSAVAASVRATAAVLAPLVLGRLLGQPLLGLMVAIGALNVSLADAGGPFRSRARTMAAASGRSAPAPAWPRRP